MKRLGYATQALAARYAPFGPPVQAADGSWIVRGPAWIDREGRRGRTYYGRGGRAIEATDAILAGEER